MNAEATPLPDVGGRGPPLEATEMLRISSPGIIAYHVRIGEQVEQGQRG